MSKHQGQDEMKNYFIKLLLCLPLWGVAQSLLPVQSTYNVNSTSENQTDSVWIELSNNSTRTAYIKGFSSFEIYGKKAFSVRDSIFTISPQGIFGTYIYFSPNQNVFYDLPIIFHCDSAFGSIAVRLNGQGIFSNTYYNSTQNLSGSSLKNQLANLLSNNYNTLSYDNARDQMYGFVDNINGNITCVYTGRTAAFSNRSGANANNFNAEHTYPQSFGASVNPMRTDLHHLFPTDATANSIRNNHPFGTVNNATWSVGGSKYGASLFEPRDAHKGAVARALFYYAVRYQDNNFIQNFESQLRQWHVQHPPVALELTRNNRIFSLQNNRNPFVDYPQFLDRLTSVTGSSNLPAVNQWVIFPDTVWLVPQITASISIINTGNQNLTLSQLTVDTTVLHSTLPSNIIPGRAYSLNLQASNNQGFGPTPLTIYSSGSHGTKTIYVASRAKVQPPIPVPNSSTVPQPAQIGVSATTANSVQVFVAHPNGQFGTEWDGMLVFASTVPFNNFDELNNFEAMGYLGNTQYGFGSAISVNAQTNGYCVYNSSTAQHLSFEVSGLQASTNYYFLALAYKLASGNDSFSTNLTAGASTPQNIQIAATCPGGLFFSEYIEGSSNNKCLELYNSSSNAINLNSYRISIFYNGGPTVQSVNLSGSLASGQTFVICNPGAASNFLQKSQLNSSSIGFNGNDLVSLIHVSTGDTIDRIGNFRQLNTYWTLANGSTSLENVSLVRADTVHKGSLNWPVTKAQWVIHPVNTASNLGNHNIQTCTTQSIVPYQLPEIGDRYGESLALNFPFAYFSAPGTPGFYSEANDTLLVNGAFEGMGGVYVFKNVQGNWIEWQKLQAEDRNDGDEFGHAISANGQDLAIAAPSNGQGRVYIYETNFLGQHIQAQILDCPTAFNNNGFGTSLQIHNQTMAIGAPGGIGGRVFIYSKVGGQWLLQANIQAAGLSSDEQFGTAVFLKNDSLWVSAPQNSQGGKAWLFLRQSGQWLLHSSIQASDAAPGKRFGHRLLQAAGRLFVSDPSGAKVYIFKWQNNQWNETSLQPQNNSQYNQFGSSLAYHGGLLVGAERLNSDKGGILFFSLSANQFIESQAYNVAGLTKGSKLGHSLMVYNQLLFSGAPYSQNNSPASNAVRSGSVWVFNLNNGPLIQNLEYFNLSPQYVELDFAGALDLHVLLHETDFYFSLFPNPSADGLVNLYCDLKSQTDQKLELTVTHSNGRVVLKRLLNEGQQTFSLPPGFYIAYITNYQKPLWHSKLLITQ